MSDRIAPNTPDGSGLRARLLEMVAGAWTTQTLFVAAELGIADLLAERPLRNEELAKATGADARHLARLMRALVSLEICNHVPDGGFELTELGGLLRRGVPGSVRGMALHWGGQLWEMWGRLADSVRTGKNARGSEDPSRVFASFMRDSGKAAAFNQAMVDITEAVAQAVLRAYDFAGMARVVDVGGGYGALLGAVLQAYPSMGGVLVDLPPVIAGARKYLDGRGVLPRCELVEGSFFDRVPGPADACMLKSIIHDWPDDRSVDILRNCALAVNSARGKVLLIEHVMPERIEPTPAHRRAVQGDLNMMVATGGCERTEEEFKALLERATLKLSRIVPTDLGYCVIEAVCA